MREVIFVRSSLEELRAFPDEARREAGYALESVQRGQLPVGAKPMHGFGGGVQEIVAHDEGGTYRLIYAVTMPDAVYVLHAFQKKPKQGIKMPKRELDLVKQRLREAREISADLTTKAKER